MGGTRISASDMPDKSEATPKTPKTPKTPREAPGPKSKKKSFLKQVEADKKASCSSPALNLVLTSSSDEEGGSKKAKEGKKRRDSSD